jgi:decaprenylphospho-beta-D-erythro-pentofuranosid-2-ulose 2-reductase
MPEPPAQGHDNAMDRHVFEVNVIGAVAWINEAATWFSRTGAGVIVGVGSVAGERGRSGFPAYNASKAALHTFLEAQRNRLARHGVRVVTIKPGPVQTAMLRGRQVPLTVTPEAVAAVITDSIESGALVRYVHWVWGPIMQVIRNIPSFVFRRFGPP